MLIRTVPSTELSAKSLRAEDYMQSTPGFIARQRAMALRSLYAARARYLRKAGWKPFASRSGPDSAAYTYWVDPKLGHQHREDRAAAMQEERDNALVYKDKVE